ncbi:MAG: TetR/AcrR family transcriptional regulator [Clostridiales bacterium]|nr:TetR/AcrR family transcriptional regulator [Clostridiales bacterium]
MIRNEHEDLRVYKTKKAIKEALIFLICKTDCKDISVSKITERSMISRNTFYAHYKDLDELFEEFQDEYVRIFISENINFKSLKDIKILIRLYFEFALYQPEYSERLMYSESYRDFFDKVNKKITDYYCEKFRGTFGLDELSEKIIITHCCSNTALLCRRWVEGGKAIPFEDAVQLAVKLICSGISEYIS